ncbi:MAG: DNA polymerase Y family protein [Burkholderiaceae bacterium]
MVALSAQAAAAGVRSGMRRGGVLSLCPHAILHERDAEREQTALGQAALAMLQYTPEVAQAEENSLLLDVGASLSAFGGRRALCRRVVASIEALGFSVRIGMAPTAQGAWLLAYQGVDKRRRTVQPASMARRLDALPFTVLPAAREHADWLQGIGCRTLADLRRLPRAGLQRRCGGALPEALARAYGEAVELYEWVQVPATFSARLELPDRIEHAEAVLFAARRLLLQMAGWLVARQLAVARFVLLLEHERGRMAIAPTAIEIALAEPAWHEAHLVRLLQERLARTALPAAVIALRLQAPETRPMAPITESLFPEPGGTPADYRRLLELLTARLGAECVLTPVPRADHRPEVRNGWAPADGAGCATPSRIEFASGERPFWLLQSPLPLPLRAHRPFYGSPLTLVRGPERIECGWWDGMPVMRDYFVAQSATAVCYWIYRQRNGEEVGWFLHGLFA